MCVFSPVCYTVKLALSVPHITRASSIKRTPAWVPKFSSHIYCKLNLYSEDPSIKRTSGLQLGSQNFLPIFTVNRTCIQKISLSSGHQLGSQNFLPIFTVNWTCIQKIPLSSGHQLSNGHQLGSQNFLPIFTVNRTCIQRVALLRCFLPFFMQPHRTFLSDRLTSFPLLN